MTEYWRDVSLEGKWKDGKGHVVLSRVDWYGIKWLDLRIMNMHRAEGQTQHTKHGLRLTVKQVKELLPVLVQIVDEIESEDEKDEREKT